MTLTPRIVVISRGTALAAVAIVLGYGAYQYALRFGKLDPFSSLKRGIDPLGANTGVRLSDVRVHEYQKGRLVASAHADVVDVTKDRSTFDLLHVKDGFYHGANGVTHFAASKAAWNTQTQGLAMSGGSRVQGKDFDIQTSGATFDRQDGTLRVGTSLSGRLYGGNVEAASLTYNMKTGATRTGAIHWQGKLPVNVTQSQGDQILPRTWSIDGENYTTGPKGIEIYENGRATDGEVLIIFPHAERDPHTDVVTATGRVSYFSGKADVVADKVVIYRKEKRAVFTGNVLMLVKPKKDQDRPPAEEKVPEVKSPPDVKPSEDPISPEEKKRDEDLRSGKTVREYPLNIKAEEITYWYGKGQRHAVIEGNPVAHQDFTDGRWRHGDSHDAYYDGELDTMQLNSLPGHRDAHLKNSIGDRWAASMLKFSTKEDETEDNEDVTGKLVTGTYVDTSGEDTRDPKKKTPPIPAKPGVPTTPGTPGTQPPPTTQTGGAQGATGSKGGG